jgi:hypothetical protein
MQAGHSFQSVSFSVLPMRAIHIFPLVVLPQGWLIRAAL